MPSGALGFVGDAPTVSSASDTTTATSRPGSMHEDPRLGRWRRIMFLGLLLLLVFAVASYAIIRFSRNYRRYLLREPPKPTPADDVWEMHKLPEDADSGDSPDDGGWDDGPDDEFESDRPGGR